MSREALLQELGSDQRSRLRAACDAATEVLREDPEFRHGLIDLLSRGEPRARFAAAFVLFHHERPTLRLLPPLLDALELDDGALRWSAARLLAALGRLHGEVLPVLLEAAAKSPSPTRRRMALYVLRELAPEAPQTHAVFLGALGDPDSSVQLAALASLRDDSGTTVLLT
ncbi:MAG: HEAT repeat domain-containing protein, partial [Myxococcota bacterium]